MIFIAHRRNTTSDLKATPETCGVEVDVRSMGDRLIVQHDPFLEGEPFEAWVAAYRHRALILNVKEEGLEDRLLGIMRERGIEDFFFLDQSFPFLLRTAMSGERRSAVRVSEFESPETALSLAGRVDWVWIDCFSRFPLDREGWQRLRGAGFKLCLVSPELVGRPVAEIGDLRGMLRDWGVEPDAACSKLENHDRWMEADRH